MRIITTIAVVLVIATARGVAAQTNAQLWGNVTFGWSKTDHLTYEIDLEPKVLLTTPENEPGWWNLDATPSVEYAVRSWMDLTGELATGFTKQTDEQNSFELTPRVGVRFHLFSRDLPTIVSKRMANRERPPRRRVVVRYHARMEYRNFFYTNEEPTSSSWRYRSRLEVLFPLNRDKITTDGARYLLADWEWFVPLDDLSERFANRQRIRSGLGHRWSPAWRFEAVYIWTRSRNTIEEGFATSDNALNIRMKRTF